MNHFPFLWVPATLSLPFVACIVLALWYHNKLARIHRKRNLFPNEVYMDHSLPIIGVAIGFAGLFFAWFTYLLALVLNH